MGLFDAIASTVNTTLDIGNGWLTNAWSAGKAKDAWHRNLWMADSAHQREVADLRKAGLNPILSAMNGSGAPAIAAPTPQVTLGKSSLVAGQSARAQSRLASLAERKIDAELDAINAQTKRSNVESKLIEEKTTAEVDLLRSQVLKNDAETGVANRNSAFREAEIARFEKENEFLIERYGLEFAEKSLKNNLLEVELMLKTWGLTYNETYGFITQLVKDMKGFSLKDINGLMGLVSAELFKNKPKTIKEFNDVKSKFNEILNRSMNDLKENKKRYE